MAQAASLPDAAAIAAIVVTYRTGPVLFDCLDALAGDAAITHVVVVDNGNPPDVESALRDRAAAWPKAKLLTGHGNVGFARGCNLGAAAAPGAAHLLFVNPDLVLDVGAAAALAGTAARGPQPCVAGGRLLDDAGREQRGARRDVVTPWSAFVAFSGLTRLERFGPVFRSPYRERDPPPPGPIRVGAVSGALMCLTRAGFEALGGFDEGYFLHLEDMDLCRRAAEAGGAVWFDPRACGRHRGATSDAPAAVVERHKAAGYARYFRKFARGPWDKLQAEAMALALPWILTAPWSLRRRAAMRRP
ncbi:MAG: glycosyltransferase family 2 protein [Hyphomonadaceae bacterium]|nr:glycosyltransferase family 2 protein [Hyphomonadaceae bacterium]